MEDILFVTMELVLVAILVFVCIGIYDLLKND